MTEPVAASFIPVEKLQSTHGAQPNVEAVADWINWMDRQYPDAGWNDYVIDVGWGNDRGCSPGIVVIIWGEEYEEASRLPMFLHRTFELVPGFNGKSIPVYFWEGHRSGVNPLDRAYNRAPMFGAEFDFSL